MYSAGVEYEHKLNQMLAKANVAFWTEEHLRDKGFFKTPDAKLQVPQYIDPVLAASCTRATLALIPDIVTVLHKAVTTPHDPVPISHDPVSRLCNLVNM